MHGKGDEVVRAINVKVPLSVALAVALALALALALAMALSLSIALLYDPFLNQVFVRRGLRGMHRPTLN